MAKYELEVIKEVKNEYTFSNEVFLQDLFNRVITDFRGSQIKYSSGTKWIRIFDSQNDLVLYEFSMPSKKEFIAYCKSKGINFKKK